LGWREKKKKFALPVIAAFARGRPRRFGEIRILFSAMDFPKRRGVPAGRALLPEEAKAMTARLLRWHVPLPGKWAVSAGSRKAATLSRQTTPDRHQYARSEATRYK
jgi:hypothetical protein